MKQRCVYSAVVALALIATSIAGPAQTAMGTAAAPQAAVRVRFLNSSPDAPALDVLLDGDEVFGNTGFAQISGYTDIASSTYTVTVRATGTVTPLLTSTLAMTGGDYTLIAAGTLAASDEDLELMLLTDDNTNPTSGLARARFVHLVPDAPYPVTIAIEGEPVFEDVVYGDVTPYVTLAAGTYTLQVLVYGTEVATGTVTVGPNSVYSFFAVGLASGTPELDILEVLDASYYHPGYTLDVDIIGNGDVAVDPDKATHPFGELVTLTATAAPGWTFIGWSGDLDSTENPVAFEIDRDMAVTATFIEGEYVLDVNIVGQGDVSIDPKKVLYSEGDTVTLTATAAAGWTFVDWTGDVNSSDNPLVVVIEGDTTITASFSQDQYTLDVSIIGEGDVDIDPDQLTYVYGDEVTLTASADPGWTFGGWSGACTGAGSCHVTMDGDKEVTAHFIQEEYTLDVNSIGQGEVAVEPELEAYVYGDVVTLTPAADPGWTFGGWSGPDAGDLSDNDDGSWDLVMDDDKYVTATFTETEDTYILDVNIVGQGEVAVEPELEAYVYGDVVTLTPAADPGWTFGGWSGPDAGDLSDNDDGSWDLVMDDDKYVTATFTETEDTYILDVNIVGQGEVTVDPEHESYIYGDVVTLTAIADAGWAFAGWSGDINSTENPLALTMDSNKALTATFDTGTYVITPTAGTGGVITPSTPQTVNYGDDITFTIAANPGYAIADVLVDGVSQGAIGSYTFTNVAADHTITATFALSVVPPEITSADHTTFVVGEAQAFRVTATGVPTPTITLDGTLPEGITFADNGDGTATLSGTPLIGSGGDYTLMFTASNGVLPDATQAFTLTVNTRVYLPLVLANN